MKHQAAVIAVSADCCILTAFKSNKQLGKKVIMINEVEVNVCCYGKLQLLHKLIFN